MRHRRRDWMTPPVIPRHDTHADTRSPTQLTPAIPIGTRAAAAIPVASVEAVPAAVAVNSRVDSSIRSASERRKPPLVESIPRRLLRCRLNRQVLQSTSPSRVVSSSRLSTQILLHHGDTLRARMTESPTDLMRDTRHDHQGILSDDVMLPNCNSSELPIC